jgi:hypothetical protein
MSSVQATVTANPSGLDRLINRLSGNISRAVAETAAAIVADAQGMAPVATGALRDSIKAEIAGYEAVISAGEGLPDGRAFFQEFGYHAGGTFVQHPYLTPAVERNRGRFVAEVEAAFR